MEIGIVLSGGMAKGAYQIGALKAIKEILPKDSVKVMSASSVGILNAYSFATDKLEYATQMWSELCEDNARIFIGQLLKSSILQRNIKSLCSEHDCLTQDFYITLFDSVKYKITYKNLSNADKGEISDYLSAGISFPIYNRAVQIEGSTYYDGAMLDNIPIFPLKKHKTDYIICIYFDQADYIFENSEFDKTIIKLNFPSECFLRKSAVFEKENIIKMIDEGYKKAKNVLSYIFSDGFDDKESINSKILLMNQISENKKVRITGDVLVNNLNRITKKILKKKIVF